MLETQLPIPGAHGHSHVHKAYLIMLVNKATPVQQLDSSFKAEDWMLGQQLLLPGRHVALPLCMLC